ncbi:MAG TPA: serine hydrolase domain-containing protein, partial [Bacillota bacterium]|nr:serine hydrolase domain-containing protein [Bacillota bacterium]
MESLVYAEPASLGIDPEKFKEAEAVLKEEIEKGSAPGAVALVLYQNKIAYHYAFGKRALVPEPEEITLDTIYDLASITKCVATTTACMMLMEQGLIGLEDPIAKFFPDFAGKEEITIFHLL